MKTIVLLFLLSSCVASKPSNAIEELGEEVLKKKEGLDIRLTPIEEVKQANKQTKTKTKNKELTNETQFAYRNH